MAHSGPSTRRRPFGLAEVLLVVFFLGILAIVVGPLLVP